MIRVVFALINRWTFHTNIFVFVSVFLFVPVSIFVFFYFCVFFCDSLTSTLSHKHTVDMYCGTKQLTSLFVFVFVFVFSCRRVLYLYNCVFVGQSSCPQLTSTFSCKHSTQNLTSPLLLLSINHSLPNLEYFFEQCPLGQFFLLNFSKPLYLVMDRIAPCCCWLVFWRKMSFCTIRTKSFTSFIIKLNAQNADDRL